MDDNLTEKQEAFIAAYIGEANWNATKAAKIAGYSVPRQEGARLLTHAVIKARINQYLETVRNEGLGNKAVRIAELNSLYDDLKFIQRARAKRAAVRYADGEDIPEEADSGLVVETTKQIGTGQNATITTEWSFDKAWHDSAIKTLEQIAKEVGDRDKRIELSGRDGGPIQIESGKAKLLELIDDEQES